MEPLADGVRWLPGSYPQGFSVVFARGLEPRELLLRMGCSPGSISPMTREDAEQLELNGLDVEGAEYVIRSGALGGWAYALQSWGARALEEGVIAETSAGSEVVVLVSTETVPWIAYAVDGQEICSFDPTMPGTRYGGEPDRLLPAMERVGMSPGEVSLRTDAVAAMLQLAEAEFGVGLPRAEVEEGELPAGQA